MHVKVLSTKSDLHSSLITIFVCLLFYSRPLLVIYFKYSSVNMSISNSQSIPSPIYSLLVTISLFSKSVSVMKISSFKSLFF